MTGIQEGDRLTFPARYREPKTKIVLVTSLIALIFISRIVFMSHAQTIVILAFVSFCLLIAFFGVRSSMNTETILHCDSLEIVNDTKTRIIRKDDIYTIKSVGLGRLRVYCKSLRGADVYIPAGIQGTAAWKTWIAGFAEREARKAPDAADAT